MKRSFFWPIIGFTLLCLIVAYVQAISNPGPAVRGAVYYFYPAEYTPGHDCVTLMDSTKTRRIAAGDVYEDPYNPGHYGYQIGAPGLAAGHYWVIGQCASWDYPVEYYILHDGVHTYYQDVYFGWQGTPDGGDE
jgi:hypothetical protein